MKLTKFTYSVLLILVTILIYGCSYSFTGASVPAHLKTLFIGIVKDASPSGNSYISEYATEKIVQDFIDDNTLIIANSRQDSDAVLECTITNFSNIPQAVSENPEIRNQRKVTISMNVVYRDQVKKTTIFEKSFSGDHTFIPQGDMNEEIKVAITESINKISENVLLAVVSNW